MMYEQSGRQHGKSDAARMHQYMKACLCANLDSQHVVILVCDWRIARTRFDWLATALKVSKADRPHLCIPIGGGSVRFRGVESEPANGNQGRIFIDRTDFPRYNHTNAVFERSLDRWSSLADHLATKYKVPTPSSARVL